MSRLLMSCYHFECKMFQKVNRHFDKKALNLFFRNITRIGGAIFTISAALLLLIFSAESYKMVAISSALSLALSHIPVQIVKKLWPRKRPYLTLEATKYHINPLKDHSFPSGHTTAAFSLMIPYMLYAPLLSIILLPLCLSVGLSRIYLGLHYPSDVLVGGLLGTFTGILCFVLLH
jgi:undecaprenyl-diphosphatase